MFCFLFGLLVCVLLQQPCYGFPIFCRHDTRRRRALSQALSEFTAANDLAVPEHCADVEYTVLLQMPDVHIYLTAIRKDLLVQENSEKDEDGCVDMFLMHDAGEGVGKELLTLNWNDIKFTVDEEGVKEMGDASEEEMLLIGESFTLEDILQAWEIAQVPESYDPMWDNCMMLLLDVLYSLGYTPERDIVNYVTSRLVRDNKRVVQLLNERRDTGRNTFSFLSFFDFSYITGSVYLVEIYCWQFIERHRKIWNRKAKERQEQEQSRRSLQASCSLCFGGDSPSSDQLDALALFPSLGRMSCDQVQAMVGTIADGSPECTTIQISGFAHCGCPALPPKNDFIVCDFCEDGAFEGIDFTKIVPEFPNLAFARDQRPTTCFDMVVSQHSQTSDKCDILTSLRYFCGCPGAVAPTPCTLCDDPLQALPFPDRVILPKDVTCQDVQDLASEGLFTEEQCSSVQATGGVYCGCSAPISDTCYFCDSGTRPVPDPQEEIIFNFRIWQGGPKEIIGFSCGSLEYEALTHRCEIADTFATFCGCEKPPNPCGACFVSNDSSGMYAFCPDCSYSHSCLRLRQGSPPLALSEDEIRMVPFGEDVEVSCATMARALSQFNVDDVLADTDEFTLDTEECTFWHNVMYDYCGFCAEPPPRDDACQFPCDFNDVIVPETFSEEGFQCVYNYFDSLVLSDEDREECAVIQASSRNCCRSDDGLSKKGMMMSRKKNKSLMGMRSGEMRPRGMMTKKKEQGKNENGMMKKKKPGQRGLLKKNGPSNHTFEGRRLNQYLRRMLPTDIATAEAE